MQLQSRYNITIDDWSVVGVDTNDYVHRQSSLYLLLGGRVNDTPPPKNVEQDIYGYVTCLKYFC